MITSASLGFQSASLIGTQSLYTTRSQIITSQMMLGLYQPGAINSQNLGNIDASLLNSSNINSQIQVGASSTQGGINIDGVNRRILMNDGTTNRIVIGNI